MKVQSGETVLVFNPPSKDSEFKSPRFQAHIVLESEDTKDYNGWENISAKAEGETVPFVVDGPGEYEVMGIPIKGLHDGLNAVYSVMFEDINVCHLGNFGEKELTPEAKEEIGNADILFVPIKKEEDVEIISNIIAQTEPKIVIPVHYTPATLKKFLKEEEEEKAEQFDKLTIKQKELEPDKTKIIVLKSML